MKFTRQFQVQAPIEAVTTFHTQSSSMGKITPPPIITQLHQTPPVLNDGDRMDFTLWFGPLPLRWLAQIENVQSDGENSARFTDRQIKGPFGQWVHNHIFKSLNQTTTLVIDEIEASLSNHFLWKLIGLAMWLTLPILFAYRSWKTRRLLE